MGKTGFHLSWKTDRNRSRLGSGGQKGSLLRCLQSRRARQASLGRLTGNRPASDAHDELDQAQFSPNRAGMPCIEGSRCARKFPRGRFFLPAFDPIKPTYVETPTRIGPARVSENGPGDDGGNCRSGNRRPFRGRFYSGARGRNFARRNVLIFPSLDEGNNETEQPKPEARRNSLRWLGFDMRVTERTTKHER